MFVCLSVVIRVCSCCHVQILFFYIYFDILFGDLVLAVTLFESWQNILQVVPLEGKTVYRVSVSRWYFCPGTYSDLSLDFIIFNFISQSLKWLYLHVKKHSLLYSVLGVSRILWLKFGADRRVTLLGWAHQTLTLEWELGWGCFFLMILLKSPSFQAIDLQWPNWWTGKEPALLEVWVKSLFFFF